MPINRRASSVSSTGSGTGIDSTITSWSQLVAKSSEGIAVDTSVMFIDSDNRLNCAVYRAGTDANDPANGIRRPADFNASTNAKVIVTVSP